MNKTFIKYLFFIWTAIVIACNSPQSQSDDHKIKTDTLMTIDSAHNIKASNTPEIQEWKSDSALLEYMNRTYLQLYDTVHLSNKTLGMENCGWKLSYKGGHFYEDSQCQEMGYTVRVKIAGINKTALIKLVEQNCFRPNYSWYNDSTEYRPEEYYERVWTFYIVKYGSNFILELHIT